MSRARECGEFVGKLLSCFSVGFIFGAGAFFGFISAARILGVI